MNPAPKEADKELDELALEIMNATGGKYTDQQEEEMLQAIVRFRDKAVVAELESLKKRINIHSWSETDETVREINKVNDFIENRLNQLKDGAKDEHN